jgi:hypothetical protein
MKKPHLRALTKLAQRLPISYELITKGSLVQGSEILFNNKHKDLEFEVLAENFYKKTQKQLEVINHFNRLKRAYARNKEQGIIDYVKWVDANNKQLNEMFEELKLKEVESGIMKVIEKGANGFWRNIIQFLLAFAAVFIGKTPQE